MSDSIRSTIPVRIKAKEQMKPKQVSKFYRAEDAAKAKERSQYIYVYMYVCMYAHVKFIYTRSPSTGVAKQLTWPVFQRVKKQSCCESYVD